MEIQGKECDRGDIAREIVRRFGPQIGAADSAQEVVDAVLDALPAVIADAIVQFGGRVEFHELGVFTIKQRKARKGRNLLTGETITIPEHQKVTFKAAAQLRETVEALTQKHTI